MPLFRSIVFAAVLAGLLAGLFATLAQMARTVPLIQAAEILEHEASAEHDHGGWAPADGLERTAFTTLANLVTATGFALLLVAAFALATNRILHGVALVEDDHSVKIGAQPFDDLPHARKFLAALVGPQRGVGGK